MNSILQTERQCYLCGKNGYQDGLEEHHIYFGTANRKKSEQYGLKVRLCGNECHRNGKHSVHKNAKVCRKLQAEAQKIAMNYYDWNLSDWMQIFNKNYI